MKTTTKAGEILRRIKRRSLFQSPEMRDRVLDEFSRSTLGDVGPVGGEQGTKRLSEMNSLVDDHEEFVKSLAPNVHSR